MSKTGQCLCGAIQYELQNPPAMSGVCHCKNCQRQAGSAFSTLAGVAKSDFVLKSGEMKLYSDSDTDSGNTVERYFCGDCGSPIYSAVPGSPDGFFLVSRASAQISLFLLSCLFSLFRSPLSLQCPVSFFHIIPISSLLPPPRE